MKQETGITLIALIISIILLLILAGIAIHLTIGENGLITKAKSAKKYEVSAILEKLELEKVDLIAKNEGELLKIQDYIDHLILKEIISSKEVQEIDDNTKNITIDGNIFMIKEKENGEIEITYDEGKPHILKIEVIEVSLDTIQVKVIASRMEEGIYTYAIKNITTGETNYTIKASNIETDEYKFTDLVQENEYKIQVKAKNHKGESTKETELAIKTELPKVISILLDKTEISLPKGTTEELIATVLPTNAKDTSITWKSSNTSIIMVNTSGKITAVKEGSATITAIANGGVGISATCNVTVTPPPPPSVTVGKSSHIAKEIKYTWKELEEIAKAISNNRTITSSTTEIEVTINGVLDTLGIGDTTKVNGKKVRILGFNHDELVDKHAYGEEKTNTYAGISFQYDETAILGDVKVCNKMSETWGNCNIRTILNTGEKATYTYLENKKQIKEVKKKYVDANSNLTSSEDRLWLLSAAEIWGSNSYNKKNEGTQYQFYNKEGRKDKEEVLTRSQHEGSPSGYFCFRTQSNTCGNYATDSKHAIFPGFAI